jgi:FHS family L-fucose permease-like MFS transporter
LARSTLTIATQKNPRFAFAAVTALFFGWGFVCANNDPLLAALRRIFSLSYTEALLTQIVFFLAFATVSLPAAALLARLGAVRTMGVALAAMAAGCLVIQTVAWVPAFSVVLAGLFLVAAGVTALQVAANPLAAALGPPERSHFRLTLAHSFNSLGVVLGVHFGARFILAGDVFRSAAPLQSASERATGIAAVTHAFLVIGALILILAVLVVLARRAIGTAATPVAAVSGGVIEALRSRWAVAGAVGIAVYVGAEVSIGSVLILYLAAPGVFDIPFAEAGAWVANLYWGGALAGRFLGSWALRYLPAPRLLAGAAATAAALCGAALLLPGAIGGWCLLAIGLFNSIMFPTIFGLTLERSDASPEATSGLLCLAIGAGAVLPLLVGRIADNAGLEWTFAVPMLAYVYVLALASRSARLPSGVAAAEESQ